MNFKKRSRVWLWSMALVLSPAAWAAGGHHAVDDAAILEVGTCEVESWLTRAGSGERLVHAGVGCRVGPVEMGLATERAREPGASQTGYGLQVKWARELTPGVQVGLSLSPAWQAHVQPRYQGSTASALLTWAAREDLAVHVNVGRDFLRGSTDQSRSGAAIEWTPAAGWSVLAERYLEQQTHFLRAGLRLASDKNWTADLSRAQRLSGPGLSNWTFGLSWVFDRR